ncbi:MAG: M14 family zinc carboxypeptidase, partial [Armatimonadota bacterium]
VRCWSLGTTGTGRIVAMAAVYDPDCDPTNLRRLMVIARQHGNEPSGTEAALALLRHLAESDGPAERALLRREALLIIPMANPDGAARSSRRNAAGVDLNRDWQALSQPETRAIEAAFETWRPDAVVDLHELPASSSKPSYQEDFVETIGRCDALPALLGERCGRTGAMLSVWMRRYGFPLNCYYDAPGDDTRLCHRHFGLVHQVPSYLFEAKTGRGRSLADRARYHILGTLVVANQVAYHFDDAPGAVQVAAAPPGPDVEGETAAASAPVRTMVTLGEPMPDAERENRTLLTCELAGDAGEFAYLTFEVNGRVLVMTNREPYRYSLDHAQCPEGQVRVAARAFDATGRCIASDERMMALLQPGGTLGE